MKIYREESLKDFEAWAGAKHTLDKMIERETVEDFEALIEELYPEGLSETELNDILWFDDELTAEYTGEYDEEGKEV